MADAIVSAVADQLISVATDKIHHEINLVRGVEEELLDLSDKLKNVRYVLDDADMKQFKDERVKDWLLRLEQTSYEMEDVLEEWNYAARQHEVESGPGYGSAPPPKHKVCSFIPSSCFCFKKLVVRRDIAQKIQYLKSKLDGLLKEKDQFNFLQSQPVNHPSPASWRVQTTSWIDLAQVQGRNDDKDILANKLAANMGSGYQVLCIVGTGGLGKTTLAQLVYNDSRVEECFDLRIWICVSDPLDVIALAKGIIESIKPRSSPDTNQLDPCLKVLRETISGKRFLLVLDDVWNEEDEKWKPLKDALECGGAGSKILVTTRKEMVARIIGTADEDILRPKLLSDEDCWLLMKRKAFSGRSQSESAFDEIGKKIAKKCNGLPLAAMALGSVLVSKNTLQEWDNVLKSEMWELEKEELKLFPHLLLSYRELSPMLKRCFSFYAFFPKDTELKVEELIRIWMALDYLGSNTKSAGEDMELKGREIFKDLAMRSLFQDFGKDESTEQLGSCKMHDIVHDFTQFLRKNSKVEAHGMIKKSCQDCDPFSGPHKQEYCRLFWDKEPPTHFCDCLARLRVLKFNWQIRDYCPRGMGKLIHLRWMNIGGTKLSKEDLESICKLYFLQTLLLDHCSIEEIPGEIGNLVHLKHLSLNWNERIKELPESMGSLSELRTLLLGGCSIEEIPEEIMNWNKLRYLNLSSNDRLKKLPERICSFHELQTLDIAGCWSLGSFPEGLVARLPSMRSPTGFLGGSGCNKFELLKNLNNLHGSLDLMVKFSGDSDVEELVRDAREAELKNKIHLQELAISFRIMNESDGAKEECSSSSSSLLSLPSSLWVDVIEALQPHDNLQSLEIWDYKGLRLPNWIASPLNRVRDISLFNCREVLSLPPLGKLPFLEELDMYGFDKLKVVGVEWLGIRGEVMDVESSSSLVAFPKLKTLSFSNCGEWCEWEDVAADEEEVYADASLMPCLSQLYINWCGGLKMLPHRLLRKASSLKVLHIRDSPELIKCYGGKDGSPWKSITQHNPQLQLITGMVD